MTNVQPGVNPESQLPCPPWCTTDHARTDRFERYVEPVMDLRSHTYPVATIANPGAGPTKTIGVELLRVDNLTEQTVGEVTIEAWGAECMTPTTAVELAAALLAAAALLRDDQELAQALAKVAALAGESR